MPVSPARKLAFKILLKTELGRGSTDELLTPGVPALDEADHRLATEIVQGTLRFRGDLDRVLSGLSGRLRSSFDAQVLTALRMGAYQIRWLKRIPKSASVNESVELVKQAGKRSAAGLVNAVLRKCEAAPSRPGDSTWNIVNPKARACAIHSLPQWLRERWRKNFGDSGALALAWAALQRPRVSLRVMGGVSKAASMLGKLREAGLAAKPGRLASSAIVVDPGSPLSRLNSFIEGQAVIQDEASQAVASLLGVEPAGRVLDLCAAPGIKTSQIACEIQAGILVACERSGRRLKMMKKLLPRWMPRGATVKLVQLDASEELPFGAQFDRILLDVPCSGTGTLARNPEIKWRLEPADLIRYAERQRRMLRNALSVLAPGGRLVYSTCSLEPEENVEVVEDVMKAFADCRRLGREEITREFPALDSLVEGSGYFLTRPDIHGTDGFFAAVIARGSHVRPQAPRPM